MHPPELRPIELDDAFHFACHRNVACFNQCCRDLNQALTPYDVLQIRKFLSITSTAFIETYALIYTGPATGLPVVTLRFNDDPEKNCPFVTSRGCRIYPARPSSCRTYPLARALRRNRSDGRVSEHFALIREPHCLGFEQPVSRTVRQWAADQELAAYHPVNDALLDLIALKNQIRPGPLSFKHQQMARIAFYDLEALQEKALGRELSGMDNDQLKPLPLKGEDEAWLRWGLRWITQVLFGKQFLLNTCSHRKEIDDAVE